MTVDRFKLHTTYRTHQFKYGQRVTCEVRGDMIITGISDATIPWPVGRQIGRGGPAILIVFKGLARAVRREFNQAVAHHWGISGQTVTIWRNALGVDPNNRGTARLRSAHYKAGTGEKIIAGLIRVTRDAKLDAARRAKIAAAKTGKRRPRHVIEALRQANLGKSLKASTRAKMSATRQARGTRPPWLNASWTPEEDALLLDSKLSIAEVAERTGRIREAVRVRRKKLGLPDLRRREHRKR